MAKAGGLTVPDRDRRLAVFGEAAATAIVRGHTATAVRLLAITAAEATEAGCPEAAEVARELLLKRAPRHALGRVANVAEAMRNPEISEILSSVRREFPFEEAELWAALRPVDDRPAADGSAPTCGQVTGWLQAADRSCE